MVRRFRRMTAFLLVFVLFGVLLPPLPSKVTAAEVLSEEDALAVLREFQIVRGDETGNVNVTNPLTRAQAAALFVRSVGMEQLAAVLKESVPFADARGHWAAGEIAMAERLGLMRGDPSGNFRPDAEITYVEVMTVLLRMAEREPTGPWSADRITATAKDLNILPAGVNPGAAAIRGRIFQSLAVTMIDLPINGNNLLKRYHDQVPPVIRLNTTAMVTQDERAIIAGYAPGAARVSIQGTPANLDRKTGQFAGETRVEVGTNTVTVVASDFAGNQDIATVTVERQGVISRLKITGPAWVLAESNTKLTVDASDSRGNLLPLDGVQASTTGDLATFDLETQTLRAGSKPGKGTLTLVFGKVRATYNFEVLSPSDNATGLVIAPVNANRAPALNQEVTVTVQVVNQYGQVVANDYGRPVTLRAEGLAGVTIVPVQPVTEKGIALFTLKGTQSGALRLGATAPGLTESTRDLEILSKTRVILTSSAKSLMPDGVTTTVIRATLQDDTGKVVNNTTNADMQILLTATGTDGTLTDAFLTIPRGKSNSTGNDGSYAVGIAPGEVTVTGQFTSPHDFSIQTLPLAVTDPLPGFQLALSSSPVTGKPNGSVTLTLRVLDATNRLVTAGSYAFQLKVHTSNNDPLLGGVPDGVTLTYVNSPYLPVDDSIADNDPRNNPFSVIGRTDKGVASFTLRYNRSGVVTVTPVLLPATYEAYHPVKGIGPASASSQLYGPSASVVFSGTPHHLTLAADSDLGYDLPTAATSSARQIKVRARVVDADGALVPSYNGAITLARENGGRGISSIVGYITRNAVNGVAEFAIQASGAEGYDLYRVTAGTMTSDNLTLSVHKQPTDTPRIVAVRGIGEGNLAPTTGYVGPEADYLDVQLLPQPSSVIGEPTNWVTAKVFHKGESAPFFTSKPIDLASPFPIIHIPRSVLRIGEYHYEVTVNNGAGDSPRSVALDDTSKALVAAYASGYTISRASYDAATGKLTLNGSFATNGLVRPEKIRLVKGSNAVDLQGATAVVTPWTIVLVLGAKAQAIDPNLFHGAVSVVADDGWFAAGSGEQIAQSQTVPVTPMAMFTHASVDASGKYLYLYGNGFSQGTLAAGQITIHGANGNVTLNPNTERVTAAADYQLVVALSTETLNRILALSGPLHVTGGVGWLRASTGSGTMQVGAITGTTHPAYLHVRVMTVVYNPAANTLTLSGSGFNGATLDPKKLQFRQYHSSSAFSPAGTDPVTASQDGTVVITLSDSDAGLFENYFTGKNIYLNTQEEWLIDSLGRRALPLPENSVLFPVPSN